MMIHEICVDLIKEEMMLKNITQKDLCSAIGCTEASMSRYLTKQCKMPLLVVEMCFHYLGYYLTLHPIEERR